MESNIESHLVENRVFNPPPEFAQRARIGSRAEYERLYRESIDQPEQFWAREAGELVWRKKWNRLREWNAPFAKWFIGGELNLSENCLDRHLSGARRNKAALIWVGEPGEVRT